MAKRKLIPLACCISLLGGCASNKTIEAQPQTLRVEPMVSVEGASGSAASLYQLGRYYQGQNRYDQAIAAYKKALSVDYGFVEANNGLGVIYSRMGRYDEAVDEFTDALRKSPEAAHIYSNLGYTYYLQGKYDESIIALKHATTLNPDNERAQANLGLVYAKAGKTDGSTQTFASSEYVGEVAATTDAVEVLAVRQQDAQVQTTSVRGESLAHVSGAVIPAGDAGASQMKVVQVAPAVYELQEQKLPQHSELGQSATAAANPVAEKIQVEVANGNGVPRMAKKVGEHLRQQGYPTARLTNQKPFRMKVSQIQYRDGYQAAALRLQSDLPGQQELVKRNDLRAGVSVRLVLGKDLVQYRSYFKAS
jgi:tetratricopeptide (TPR) repeat protein